jgi:hypothetical protein
MRIYIIAFQWATDYGSVIRAHTLKSSLQERKVTEQRSNPFWFLSKQEI